MSEQAQGAGARVNTGGPAHPFLTWQSPQGFSIGSLYEGLTIRDHFAGLALSGWPVTDHGTNADALARKCYAMADAMIAARGH